MVWDNEAEEPASFGGQILHGMTEGHAIEVAKIMNELYGNRNRSAEQPARVQLGAASSIGAGLRS
jgi:hypothetical protein